MKKYIILSLLVGLLIPILVSAECEQIEATREGHCMAGRVDPCYHGFGWDYSHVFERAGRKGYDTTQVSCRACAWNSSYIWVHNDGSGWKEGKCGMVSLLSPQPVIPIPISDPDPYCEDGTCDPNESCDNCSQDCGQCPPPDPEPEDSINEQIRALIVQIQALIQQLLSLLN